MASRKRARTDEAAAEASASSSSSSNIGGGGGGASGAMVTKSSGGRICLASSDPQCKTEVKVVAVRYLFTLFSLGSVPRLP